GGGHLVVGPFSGVVDQNEQIHDGGAPGPLRDLIQIEVDEWWPVPDGETRKISFNGETITAALWTEWLEPQPGATVIAHYVGGPLDGRPAITCSRLKEGTAWYVSAALRPDGIESVLGSVLEASGLPFRSVPNRDLEVVTRSDGITDYTFVLNHGTRFATVSVPPGARELLTGTRLGGSINVAPLGVAVLAHDWAKVAPFLSISTDHDPQGALQS
ncbi:MAG: beta-galactosidase trimerization domain-containing protein, partial [Terrimesophilobacter sp.]